MIKLIITYYGHTAFKIESLGHTILIDPGVVQGNPLISSDEHADLILITVDQEESLGNAVEISTKSKAWILGNDKVIEKLKLKGAKPWLLHEIKPEEIYELPWVTVHAYGLERGPLNSGSEKSILGYFIDFDEMKIAHMGESITRGYFEDLNMNILMIPIGGVESFDVKSAVSLTVDSKPNLVIPMRWTEAIHRTKFRKYINQFAPDIGVADIEPGESIEVLWAAGNEFRWLKNE